MKMSQPSLSVGTQICADKQDAGKRNILFLLRRPLPGLQWCHTMAWNCCKEDCWSPGFLWYTAGALPEKCTSTGFWVMFLFEVLQYRGFWKQHLFFFAQMSISPPPPNGEWSGLISFERSTSLEEIVNHKLPNLMMKHTRSPLANREGWFYSFIVRF